MTRHARISSQILNREGAYYQIWSGTRGSDVWYLVVTNYSFVHCWMAYREPAIAVFGIAALDFAPLDLGRRRGADGAPAEKLATGAAG